MSEDQATREPESPETLVRAAQAALSVDDHAAHDIACAALYAIVAPLATTIVRLKIPLEDVPDVVADVLAKFFAYLSKGTPVPHVRALLNKISHDRIVDYYRKRNQGAALEPLDAEQHQYAAVAPGFEAACLGELVANDILDALLPELKDVAYARFVAYLGVQQTAEELGLTVDVVKKRSVLVQQKLREIIAAKGYEHGTQS